MFPEKRIQKEPLWTRGSIFLSKEAMEAVLGRKVKKGDVFTVAQVAGIMGAKKMFGARFPFAIFCPYNPQRFPFRFRRKREGLRWSVFVKLPEKQGWKWRLSPVFP